MKRKMKSKLRNLWIKYCTKRCKTGEETAALRNWPMVLRTRQKLRVHSLVMNWRWKTQKNFEFQRAHRIGKKKTEETRVVIVRFLRFPERELVLRRVRELADDFEGLRGFSYRDKRRKKKQKKKQQQQQWARLKKTRKEGSKDRFFSKPEPDKLFVDGHFVPF